MRIAVLDDYQRVAAGYAEWDRLAPHEVVFFHEHLNGVDLVAEALQGFEAACLTRERTPFPAALIERLPELELLVTMGQRNRAIDVDAAIAHGITVCGTEGGSQSTKELAWALILALARNLPAEDRLIREGGWQGTIGGDLAGKTLGLLGLGRIGGSMVPVAVAFGMDVVAWSQNLTAERTRELGVQLVSKEELFRRADFLSIHLILSERTRGLVGAEDLASMKPTAFLVNTSRGPIVDEDALVAALEAGAIGGAGLDVYAVEPLPPGHRIRGLPGTVLAPHLGYVTHENYTIFFPQIVEAIEAYLAGTPIRVIPAGDPTAPGAPPVR